MVRHQAKCYQLDFIIEFCEWSAGRIGHGVIGQMALEETQQVEIVFWLSKNVLSVPATIIKVVIVLSSVYFDAISLWHIL